MLFQLERPQPTGDVQDTGGRLLRGSAVAAQHRLHPHPADGERQLRRVAGALEQAHRLLCRIGGSLAVTNPPLELAQIGEGRPESTGVTDGAVQLDSGPGVLDRFRLAVDAAEGEAESNVEVRKDGGLVGPVEGDLVEPHPLADAAPLHRLLGGQTGVPLHQGLVTDGDRVMNDPGEIGQLARHQHVDHAAVQLDATQRRQRILDGVPGELVAEPEAGAVVHQDAGGDRPVGGARAIRRSSIEVPRIERAGSDRHHLHHGPRLRVEPEDARHHRVLDRRRQPAAARQYLGHVERVAPCGSVQ